MFSDCLFGKLPIHIQKLEERVISSEISVRVMGDFPKTCQKMSINQQKAYKKWKKLYLGECAIGSRCVDWQLQFWASSRLVTGRCCSAELLSYHFPYCGMEPFPTRFLLLFVAIFVCSINKIILLDSLEA